MDSQDLRNIYNDVAALQEEVAMLKEMITDLTIEDSGWIPLELNEGWSMNDYATEIPMYRKIGKLVMLRGLVSATSAASTTIAVLPKGFYPSTSFNRFPCALNQTDMVNVQVSRHGITDYTKGTKTRTFLCLNGISFFVD